MAAVCVFCASSSTLEPRWLDLAARTGQELAARGHTLVSGGGRVGMMGAVADAARAGGAHTLGVIPQTLVDLEIADTAADELIVTADMGARKNLMIERSEAFLALPGGLGTLDELFEAITLVQTRKVTRFPVILMGTAYWSGLMDWIKQTLLSEGKISPEDLDLVQMTDDIDEAVQIILTADAALAEANGKR